MNAVVNYWQEVVCGDKKNLSCSAIVTTLLHLGSRVKAFVYWCKYFILLIKHLQPRLAAGIPVFYNIFSLVSFNENS